MKLDRDKLQEDIHKQYREEHEALGEAGTYRLLDAGRQWDFSETLRAGGVIAFPHAGVADCGHQIAAAVHGCLDSGSERAVVSSVLHAFTDEMEAARGRGRRPQPGRDLGHSGARHHRTVGVGERYGEILDIAVTDATDLYNAEPPTWVAGALIEWKSQAQ